MPEHPPQLPATPTKKLTEAPGQSMYSERKAMEELPTSSTGVQAFLGSGYTREPCKIQTEAT